MTRVQSIVVFSVAVAFMLAGSPIIAPHSGNQAEARHQPSMASDLSPVPAASPHLAEFTIQLAARTAKKAHARKVGKNLRPRSPRLRSTCNNTPKDNPRYDHNCSV